MEIYISKHVTDKYGDIKLVNQFETLFSFITRPTVDTQIYIQTSQILHRFASIPKGYINFTYMPIKSIFNIYTALSDIIFNLFTPGF